MKNKLSLLLAGLALSFGARAMTHLDLAQARLGEAYIQTLRGAGAPEEITSRIRSGRNKDVRAAMLNIKLFFQRYDEFNLKKIDAFLSHALLDVRARYQRQRPSLQKKTRQKLDQKIGEIEANYRLYFERKNLFGKDEDYLRVVAGRDFLNGIGNFSNDLREAKGKPKHRTWGLKLLPFIDDLKEFAPVSDDFLSLLYSSYFRTRRNQPNQAPIIDALRKIALELAEAKGTRTEWRQLEELAPMPLDGKTINVLVFMHANSYFDTSVQGTLKLEGLSSIGNVDVIFPKFLAKRMIKSDHIITVGHGDTMQKTVDLVRGKKLNKFFIAPEGLTPIGLYEMRPLVESFATAIYDIIKHGLEVNLYPISFPDNFRFLNDHRRPIEGDKLAYGVVHPVLTKEDFLRLQTITTDPQAASHLIRWFWFSELKNDESHVLGMPSPSQLIQWYEAMVWGDL
jgi:hypothetical protein